MKKDLGKLAMPDYRAAREAGDAEPEDADAIGATSGVQVADDVPRRPLYYDIVDGLTGKVIGRQNTLSAARKRVDKLDNEWGAYRYKKNPVYE